MIAMARLLSVVLVAGFAWQVARAQQADAPRELSPGRGAALTASRCVVCHDATHITRSRLSRGEWEDNIQVMLQRGMPPVNPEEARTIIDYLSAFYGRNADGSPSTPSPDMLAADAPPASGGLFTAHACTACHAPDRRLVGPSFAEIARRYASDRDAAAKLAAKIRAGGAGNWGAVPMPAHPAIPQPELDRLARDVLDTR